MVGKISKVSAEVTGKYSCLNSTQSIKKRHPWCRFLIDGGQHFTTSEIIGTLRDMNFLSVNGEGYISTYTRTDLTNNLHGTADFRTDYQIVTKKQMRSIISLTKKREKDNED